MSKTHIKIFSSFKQQVLFGFILLSSLALFLTPVIMQIGIHFSFPLFIWMFFSMFLVFFSLFLFLRTIFVPVIQINDKEVVITRIKRFIISRQEVVEYIVHKESLEITYKKNGELHHIQLSVKLKNISDRIKNGKLEL